MNHKTIKTFLIRLLVVYLIHLIFKIGDQSINVFSDFTLRGFVFSTYFIIYGLLVWYVSAYFNSKIQKSQESSLYHKKTYIFLLFSFHFIFGFVIAFSANMLYRLGDIYFLPTTDQQDTSHNSNQCDGYNGIPGGHREINFISSLDARLIRSVPPFFDIQIHLTL